VSAIFLETYLKAATGSQILPQSEDDLRILQSAYMLERALAEIEHELEHRPQWLRIPLHGILEQVKPV